MILHSALTAVVLIMFLERLIRDAGCKVFLIMDNLRVHHSRLVQDWLAHHKSRIEVFYLPAYSPQLNPNEGINGNLKGSSLFGMGSHDYPLFGPSTLSTCWLPAGVSWFG